MRYRTIVAYVDDEQRCKNTIKYARVLAESQGSHLIGLAVMPSFVDIPPTELGTQMLIDDIRRSFMSVTKRMQAQFDDSISPKAFSTEWRVAFPRFKSRIEAVSECGSRADLIIASQDDPDWRTSGFSDRAGLLVLQSPRPVILLPANPWALDAPARVVVAWNGSREAARALFDSIPLLKTSKSISILSINAPDDHERRLRSNQERDVLATLARHGLTADWVCEDPLGGDVGAAILAHVERHAADLLVMGGYGHFRVGELVFGGVTRDILQHMRIPVLMSH